MIKKQTSRFLSFILVASAALTVSLVQAQAKIHLVSKSFSDQSSNVSSGVSMAYISEYEDPAYLMEEMIRNQATMNIALSEKHTADDACKADALEKDCRANNIPCERMSVSDLLNLINAQPTEPSLCYVYTDVRFISEQLEKFFEGEGLSPFFGDKFGFQEKHFDLDKQRVKHVDLGKKRAIASSYKKGFIVGLMQGIIGSLVLSGITYLAVKHVLLESNKLSTGSRIN